MSSRVTRWVCEKVAQSVAHQFFVKINCGKYYCYLSRRIRVFPANFPLSVFARQIIDATLLCPLIFHGSTSILYKSMYHPLLSSIVLDSILFGSNKGYCLCSPLPSFPHNIPWKKICPNNYAMSVRFKPLPTLNNRPIGEKSPNPVTLMSSSWNFFQL
jgi:hypothetical protein